MNKKSIFLAALLLGSTQVATADEYGAIAPKLSTLGLGVEYTYPFSDTFTASAGIYGFSKDKTVDVKEDLELDGFEGLNVNATGSVKLRHFTALANYHPWSNGFHVSAGLAINNSSIDVKTTQVKLTDNLIDEYGDDLDPVIIRRVKDKIKEDGAVARLAPSVEVKPTKKVAPYLGIGYNSANQSDSGFSFTASAGVMFSKFELNGSPNCYSENLSKVEGDFKDVCSNIQKEIDDLKGDVDKIKVYPVVSLGVMYKF